MHCEIKFVIVFIVHCEVDDEASLECVCQLKLVHFIHEIDGGIGNSKKKQFLDLIVCSFTILHWN